MTMATVQFARASLGSDVILNDLISPGAATITRYHDIHLQEICSKQRQMAKYNVT